MFSKKVTCAVIVLNELHSSSENLSGGKQIKISQLTSVCGGMTAHEITTTLRELHQHNYIDRMDQGVILTCNPSEVTLYQLITSLHGGIPIGEESEQDYHHLDYYADPKHPKIVLIRTGGKRYSQTIFRTNNHCLTWQSKNRNMIKTLKIGAFCLTMLLLVYSSQSRAAGIVASITDGVAEQKQVEEQQPTTDSKVAKPKIKCSIDYRLAIKTNLLQGVASFAPNLGFEYALNNKSTIELTGALNHWGLNGSPTKNKKLAHWVIQSEYRYWLNNSFCGHFFGAHALGGKYNISGHNIPNLFLGDKLMDNQYRYTGWTIGAGVSYGYHLRFAQQWGVEFNIGIGVAHLRYDKYDCVRCGRKLNTETKTYFGPTKAGVSLIYNL